MDGEASPACALLHCCSLISAGRFTLYFVKAMSLERGASVKSCAWTQNTGKILSSVYVMRILCVWQEKEDLGMLLEDEYTRCERVRDCVRVCVHAHAGEAGTSSESRGSCPSIRPSVRPRSTTDY